MKLRKVLAGILCSAMIFTELTSVTAFAADVNVNDVNITTETEEVQETEETTIETPAIENDETSSQVGEDETAEPEEKEEGSEETEETAVEEGEKSVEEGLEEALNPESEDELTDELELDESLEVVDEELTDAAAPTNIFGIDSDGKLTFSGTSITTSKVVIPGKVSGEYVKTIPAGIFDTSANSITSIEFQKDNQIETIEDGAFKGSKIEKFTFPAPFDDSGVTKGVTVIADNLFNGCDRLTTVELNGCKLDSIGDYAFKGTKITNFTAPGEYDTTNAKKTTIGEGAFESCSELRSIYLYEVEEVGEDAFRDCTSLGKVAGSVRLTSDQKTFGKYAFANCGFTVLDISEATGITSYGDNLFERCNSLTEIYLPSVASDISNYMFSNCTKLKNVYMRTRYVYVDPTTTNSYPEKIGESAFSGCSAIQNITIPKTVKSIGACAFAGCTGLTTIEIQTDVYPEISIEDTFIKKNSLPDKESALTVKGYMDFLEEYALKKGYKYVDLANKVDVKASFGGTAAGSAKIAISPAKAKPGQEVSVTVTIDSADSVLTQNANGSYISLQTGNAPIKYYNSYEANVRMESCTNKVQKFTFNMPYDIEKGDCLYIKGTVGSTKDYANDESVINVGFSKKSVGVDFIESDPELDGAPAHIVFTKTGQQFKLRFTDKEGRIIAPWRFTYSVSTNGQKMVNVSSEGVVTAISKMSSEGKAIISAKLNSSGKTVKIAATVANNVVIDTMDFGISQTQMPKRSKYFGVNYSYIGSEAGTYEYIRDEAVYDSKGNFETYTYDNAYNMIVVPKTAIQNEPVSFKLHVYPKFKDVANGGIDSTGDEEYNVSASWTSGDTAIAKVSNSTTTSNENTITVPKGASGDTEIRVKVVNQGEEDDSPLRTFENSFIVRIVNDIPRLTSSTVTVNTNSEKGTELPIVVSDLRDAAGNYLYEIDGNNLQFDIKTTTNKIVSYVPNDYGVIIEYVDGKYYVKFDSVTGLPSGKSVIYKDLILTGKIEGEEFRIPMTSVTIANNTLSSNVSLSGKINLFYNYACTDVETKELRGKVKVTQSLTSEDIAGEFLISEKSYKRLIDREINYRVDQLVAGTDFYEDILTNDKLNKNFDLEYDESDRQWYIERTNTAMLKDEDTGKDILTGYIFTYFEGYPLPVIRKITVPTENTKPSYVLDYTSTTVNTNRTGTAYNLMLVDSRTKKPPVRTWTDSSNVVHKEYRNLLDNTSTSGINKTATEFKYNLEQTTSGLFKTGNTDIASVTTDKMTLVDPKDSTKTIEFTPYKLKVELLDTTPIKGQAVLRVKLYNWSDYIDYKFTVNTTTGLAKTVMSPSTVTYNIYDSDAANLPAQFEFKLDQSYAYIADLGVDGMTGISKYGSEDMSTWGSSDVQGHIKCTNGIRNLADETSIKELMDCMSVTPTSYSSGVISVEGADVSKIKPGNYSFTFTPRVKYSTSAAVTDYKKMNSVKFTVAVTDKQPAVKLTSASFTLNGKYPGKEEVRTTYSFVNVPAQLSSVTDKYELKIDGASDYEVYCKEKITDSHTAADMKKCSIHYADRIDLLEAVDSTDNNKHKFYVRLNGTSAVPNFSRGFLVKDVKLQIKKDTDDDGIVDTVTNSVDLADLGISVTSKQSSTAVTYTTYGSINPVDSKSGIVVRFTIKNLATTLSPIVTVNEYNDDLTAKPISKKYVAELITDSNYDVNNPASKYYGFANIALDKNKKVVPNQVIITSKYKDDGSINEPMVKDKTYKITLGYQLNSGEPATETGTISIKAAQTVPSLDATMVAPATAKGTSTTMYACNSDKSDCLVRINPKSQSNAVITGVALKSDSSAALKRAYAVEYYEAKYNYTGAAAGTYTVTHVKKDATGTRETISSGAVYDSIIKAEDKYRRSFKTDDDYKKTQGHYYVYVKLLNSAPLIMDKGTNIDIEVRYKNQIKDNLGKPTTGSTFRINVTVKK